jgi:hypothetical protein
MQTLEVVPFVLCLVVQAVEVVVSIALIRQICLATR